LTCAAKLNILLNIHFELVAVIDVYEERPRLYRFPSARSFAASENVSLSRVLQRFQKHKTMKRRYDNAKVFSVFFKNVTVS
jgi:hypothetical protein